MAHLRAVFTDPGFVTNKYHSDDDYLRGVSGSPGGGVDAGGDGHNDGTLQQQPPPSVPPHYTLCPRCNIYRPPRAHRKFVYEVNSLLSKIQNCTRTLLPFQFQVQIT